MVTGYSLNNQANYAALWLKASTPASEYRQGLTAGCGFIVCILGTLYTTINWPSYDLF